MDAKTDFKSPEYYENRELSWIKFDERVLSEARDKSMPLLERMKFASITSSNLDEFFMVRVASLKDMVHANYKKKDIAGMTASEQLSAINQATRELVNTQYSTYMRSLVPQLEKEGIHLLEGHEALTQEQERFVDQYFQESVYPVLTPMAVDASRPFPLIRNKTLNIAALLANRQKEEETAFATVQVPSVLPRLVQVPGEEGKTCFILLEQIIERNLGVLFSNYKVLCAYPYRVMRNADLTIDEDEASDLLKEIQNKLKMRQWGEVIRLEIEDKADKKLLKFLKTELRVADEDVFRIAGPLDLTFLMKLYGIEGFDHLRCKPYTPQRVPQIEPGSDIFAAIREGDIFLHHPYQTFDPVVDFIRQAAKDPDVLAIKQTLYRVSGNSPIIGSLAQAAENGKQVSVLVELKARFDEEHNIVWAKKLEQAGCHVIYGLVGLKTHSKIALVVRREEDGIRRYVHLGTGNYNDSTAKLYTDMGLLTCSESIGEDATAVFNMLSGYSEPASWNKLSLAPLWLRDRFLTMIQRESAYARNGEPAHIVAKMNSLCDPELIGALYEANAAGVKIDLIVRGICSLKVGIPGISDNISVRSIVGSFLEHTRIYYFLNGGQEEVYLASADWMPRNLDRRVEILFPIENENLKKEVMHVLEIQLQDTLKAQIKQTDGSYEKVDRRGKPALCAQEYFMEYARNLNKPQEDMLHDRVFIPAEPMEE